MNSDCQNPSCQILKPHEHVHGGVYFAWGREINRLQARIAKLRNELDWTAKYLESCGGEDSDPEVQAAKSIRNALAEDTKENE